MQTRRKVDELLAETQRQARELQSQQQELRVTNEELQQHTLALSASQQHLQAQQTALESANEELEEKARVQQEQRALLDRQNQELKTAQRELEQKAEELTLASRYKSEFLANMSHELRTPLNSLLILAQMLAGNEERNLTPEQVESARIIYHSGSDLLTLINEILDLTKVESGRMQFFFEPVLFANIVQALRHQFNPVAEERGLLFEISLADGLPETMVSDQQRLLQVLRNLLSNAFKFTTQGSVKMTIGRPAADADPHFLPCKADQAIAIRISDTGIGMTSDQQKIVFEAFQQADGSTSRKYGGTGLGLTISREMVKRLGGKIELQSEYHQGSTFTVYLPEHPPESITASAELNLPMIYVASTDAAPARGLEESPAVQPPPAAPVFLKSEADIPDLHPPAVVAVPADPQGGAKNVAFTGSGLPNPAGDDRDSLQKGDHILLVIEDDLAFAHVIYEYAHKKNFKCLIAPDGETGLQMVNTCHPDAIVLDLRLPGISGWQVLETLKHDQALNARHIPVHILSAESENLDAYKMGAIGFLTKPVTSRQLDEIFQKIETLIAGGIKNLLVVEDDADLRHSVRQLLSGSDVRISEAAHGHAAMEILRARQFDCMILDLTLPDMTGFELLNQIHQDVTVHKCPIIVYTGKELTEEENVELMKYAESIIIKGAKSPERLLEETALFLHQVVSQVQAENKPSSRAVIDRDGVFEGKHILMVDDDMRNAFALSRLLGGKGFKITIAGGGQKALEMLDADPDIDLVLMDIMMPVMDGYETMRRIRAQDRFHNLPILALTAKAMAGDKEKCIEAGADDYLSKPVDVERLLSVLRVWLSE
jgi:CheY-like chemotaxis protein/signal transduction histidine kinase